VHKIDEIYLMAALLSATAEKPCCLGFEYEFFISRFEFTKPKNKKKYSGPLVSLFWTYDT
jgi:hypothetical protein